MTLSPEQLAVIAALRDTQDNLLISACAGGAKTTTIIECCRALGPGRRQVVLAFNKNIADEVQKKLPYFAQAQTFHSFCYDALGRHLKGKPRPDGNRCRWFLKEMVPNWKERREIEDAVLTLVSRAKSSLEDTTLSDIADRFNLDCDSSQLELAARILTACATPPFKSVDFDDMLWLTLKLDVPFDPVAYVFLDEAQDTNVVQRELLRRMNPGRLIAVGDPYQAIYEFRGASSDAMSSLQQTFNMKEMELSVSYRCSVEVVKEARKYV